ncbi:MAG: hypothetical protein RSC07_01485 [Mucinivorans sp.]
MKKKIYLYLWHQRVVLMFVILSALLWYINRLNHTYTNDVDMAIRLTNDYQDSLFVDTPELKVQCMVRGGGRLLMLYELGLVPSLDIPISELHLDSMGPYISRIDPESMRAALLSRVKDISVISVVNAEMILVVSPMAAKRLPVAGRIEVYPRRQYMIEGGLQFIPDSIDVHGPKIVLDTLLWLTTNRKVYQDVTNSIMGVANLQLPRGVSVADKNVRYSAHISTYTEFEFRLPISPVSAEQVLVVPSVCRILVRIPTNQNINNLSPVARVNRDSLHSKVQVTVDSLPRNVEVVSVIPSFVECFLKN